MSFVLYSTTLFFVVWLATLYLYKRCVDNAAKRRHEFEQENSRLGAVATNYHLKLRALSESSGAGLIMLDSSGKVVHNNATADRILGCAPDAMVGHSLIQATLSGELQDFVVNAASSGKPQACDVPLPGTPTRILRASAYPFEVSLSGAAETMLVLVDITELRRLETIRRDFVANVSHELRTPLASIRAMAETLQDGALHDEDVADRFLGTIIREADRLTRISEDLLILADAESKDPVKELFDLRALCRDVVSRSEPHALEHGLKLTLHTNGPLPVYAPRDQMEQVLVNLVDNAIKYTPTGGSIDVTAKSSDEGVWVEVKDTGIGIMQEHLPRIFERFYRVDKARSRESGGTGLGLSIVKNIIESLGGEVRVSSQFNHGTTFTVVLPPYKETA